MRSLGEEKEVPVSDLEKESMACCLPSELQEQRKEGICTKKDCGILTSCGQCIYPLGRAWTSMTCRLRIERTRCATHLHVLRGSGIHIHKCMYTNMDIIYRHVYM